MPRKKPLKTPFVVTISVAAAATFAVACGGKTDYGVDYGGSTTNPPRVPTTTTCTETTRPGDPCNSTDSSCTVSSPYKDTLQCQNGQWVGSTIGNPPPPDPLCPPTEPRTNESCAPEGDECLYLDRCIERPIGSPTYRSYRCAKGTWQRENGYFQPAACPAQMPAGGASCDTCGTDYPAECSYPGATSCPPAHATCDPQTSTWQLTVSSCNPPAPDGGAGGENGP